VLTQELLDFFFPKRCLGCGRVGFFICPDCSLKLPYLENQFCSVCNEPSVGGFTHLRCQSRYAPDRFLSLFVYKGLAQNLVKELKYGKVTALRKVVNRLVLEFLEENGIDLGEKTLITFVPIHQFKLWERGFNQSQLLAEEVGKSLNLRVESFLEKVKETRSQTEFKKEDRAQNVKGSLALKKVIDKILQGQDVLLIDDVFTTGATLLECANLLKRGGVRFLYLLTLCKD